MLYIFKSVVTAFIILAPSIALGVVLGNLLGRVVKDPRLRLWVQRGLSLTLSVLFVLGVFNYYVYIGFGYQGDIFRKADTQAKIVAFTFDDGPHPVYTPAILDILQKYQVPATFFVIGAHVEAYPEVMRRIHKEGHEMGNHTFTHINVPSATSAELSAEIIKTNLEIMLATGEYPQYIRPPRGLYDDRFRRLTELLGHRIVLWSLSSQDWRPTATAAGIASRILKNVRPGDIILFHDSGAIIRSEGGDRRQTVEALPVIIEGLWALGYSIVSLEELLEEGLPEAAPQVVY